MEELWRMRAEIEVEPGDLDLESGYTKGFMNVVTWATSDESAKTKLADYLRTFNWNLLGLEESAPIGPEYKPNSELADLIDRARGNPKAIVLGTFHSYLEGGGTISPSTK